MQKINSWFKKIGYQNKSSFEYSAACLTITCFILISEFFLIKYFKNKEEQELNNHAQFIAKTINGLLLKDLQSAYHLEGQTEHLFCIQNNKNVEAGIQKIPIKNKTILCNTRLIKERLDGIIPEYINYNVSIDKSSLISKGNKSLKATNKVITNILEDIDLQTQVSIDTQSDYFNSIKKLYNDKYIFISLYLGVLWSLLITAIVHLLRKHNKNLKHQNSLKLELKKLDVIRAADNKAKIFTNNFYKYSKTIYNFSNFSKEIDGKLVGLYDTKEYMPIPLLDIKLINAGQVFKVDLEATVKEIESMIDSYKSLNSYNIIFTSNASSKCILLPFNQVLFDQILISLMANIIFFAKDRKNTRHISLVISNESITLIHDAFNLNKEMMIDYCQRLFYETKNPFLITFGQIYIMLNNVFNIKIDVSNENHENVIKIYLPEKNFTKEENILSFKKNKNEKL